MTRVWCCVRGLSASFVIPQKAAPVSHRSKRRPKLHNAASHSVHFRIFPEQPVPATCHWLHGLLFCFGFLRSLSCFRFRESIGFDGNFLKTRIDEVQGADPGRNRCISFLWIPYMVCVRPLEYHFIVTHLGIQNSDLDPRCSPFWCQTKVKRGN